jgi:hypothetical protein
LLKQRALTSVENSLPLEDVIQVGALTPGLDEAEVDIIDNGLRRGDRLGDLGVFSWSGRPRVVGRRILHLIGSELTDGVQSVEHREKSE